MGRPLILSFLLTLTLAACSDQPAMSDKTTLGTGAGAVLGGVVGHQVLGDNTGTVVGGVVGAIAGHELGKRWDARDRRQAFSAFEEDRPVAWDRENARYSINPVDTFRSSDGRLCRHYRSRVSIEGQDEVASGTACRRADGTWEIVS